MRGEIHKTMLLTHSVRNGKVTKYPDGVSPIFPVPTDKTNRLSTLVGTLFSPKQNVEASPVVEIEKLMNFKGGY